MGSIQPPQMGGLQYEAPQPPVAAYSVAPPQPVRLHWGWVLLFNVFTRSLFDVAWLIVQANWVRQVNGRSRAMPWAVANAALIPVACAIAIMVGVGSAGATADSRDATESVLAAVIGIGAIVLRLTAVYTLRSELEEAPIHIQTGGVMTFFFGAMYFQYHLYDYHFNGRSVASGVAVSDL